mgnify:CR=1 FL=1
MRDNRAPFASSAHARLGLPESVTLRESRKPFASDGCTLAPDWLPLAGNISECCRQHDRFYYDGGTTEDRAAADRKLRECLQTKGSPILSWAYWMAVRLAGHHFWPRAAKPAAWAWAGPVKRLAP